MDAKEIQEKIDILQKEVSTVIKGKDEVIRKVIMAILASGHVLLEDVPGLGKTTLAKAFSKALGFANKRIQFTPDTMPSDIVGMSIYNEQTNAFEYVEGAAVNCNLLLGDEINRTSSKTQSALLEAMAEGCVTVDGVTHQLLEPFVVMATQNPVTSGGTQALPDSQLDRFMICLSMGYPDAESQLAILKIVSDRDLIEKVQPVMTIEDVKQAKSYVKNIAEKLKEKKNYENITFASENSRCANMLSAVLKAHSTNTKASSEDFVEGGIYSHYFWGDSGLDANKLDQAIWSGWCEGLGLKTTEKPGEKTETNKTEEKTPDNKVTKEKPEIINKKDDNPEKASDNNEQVDGEAHFVEKNIPDCKAFFETLRASFSKWFGKLKKYFTRNNKEL